MTRKTAVTKKNNFSAMEAMEELDLDVSLPKGSKDYHYQEEQRERKMKTKNKIYNMETNEEESDNEQDDVVHNRVIKTSNSSKMKKGKNVAHDANRSLAVLPSDAHRRDDPDGEEFENYNEEEEMAVSAMRDLRNQTSEDDFAVANLEANLISTSTITNVVPAREKRELLFTEPAIETVERSFALLSSEEQMNLLRIESPELIKMVEEVKLYLKEVKELAVPLRKLLYERKLSNVDRELVSFLETKVHLMLSYCMNVTFYLLLKSNGEKVATHPVIDTLVEIRVYLEKMWPLEEKLQHFLNRLLSGKSISTVHLNQLRPINDNGGLSKINIATAQSAQNVELKERRKLLQEIKDAEELEQEELSAMSRVRNRRASQLNATGANINEKTFAPLSYEENEDQYFTKLSSNTKDEINHYSTSNNKNDKSVELGNLSLMERLRRRQELRHAENTSEHEIISEELQALHDPTDIDQVRSAEINNNEFTENKSQTYTSEIKNYNQGQINKLKDKDINEDAFVSDEESVSDTISEGEQYNALWKEEEIRRDEENDEEVVKATAIHREQLNDDIKRRKVNKKIESHRGLTKARPRDRKNPRVAQRRKYARKLQIHKSQSRQFHAEPDGGFVGVKSIKPTVVRSTKL